ncbi:DNA-binding protein snt1 [Mycoemilia scoparia]|uniref:DNA-binding protein snt1 n=1 Tax=Mycoemilia scoparia TaxID=417184 RepID=A0A9W8A7B6_9FUNG|nr:DNA-binding protein snt1 [Mycoemilia scoparia]
MFPQGNYSRSGSNSGQITESGGPPPPPPGAPEPKRISSDFGISRTPRGHSRHHTSRIHTEYGPGAHESRGMGVVSPSHSNSGSSDSYGHGRGAYRRGGGEYNGGDGRHLPAGPPSGYPSSRNISPTGLGDRFDDLRPRGRWYEPESGPEGDNYVYERPSSRGWHHKYHRGHNDPRGRFRDRSSFRGRDRQRVSRGHGRFSPPHHHRGHESVDVEYQQRGHSSTEGHEPLVPGGEFRDRSRPRENYRYRDSYGKHPNPYKPHLNDDPYRQSHHREGSVKDGSRRNSDHYPHKYREEVSSRLEKGYIDPHMDRRDSGESPRYRRDRYSNSQNEAEPAYNLEEGELCLSSRSSESRRERRYRSPLNIDSRMPSTDKRVVSSSTFKSSRPNSPPGSPSIASRHTHPSPSPVSPQPEDKPKKGAQPVLKPDESNKTIPEKINIKDVSKKDEIKKGLHKLDKPKRREEYSDHIEKCQKINDERKERKEEMVAEEVKESAKTNKDDTPPTKVLTKPPQPPPGDYLLQNKAEESGTVDELQPLSPQKEEIVMRISEIDDEIVQCVRELKQLSPNPSDDEDSNESKGENSNKHAVETTSKSDTPPLEIDTSSTYTDKSSSLGFGFDCDAEEENVDSIKKLASEICSKNQALANLSHVELATPFLSAFPTFVPGIYPEPQNWPFWKESQESYNSLKSVFANLLGDMKHKMNDKSERLKDDYKVHYIKWRRHVEKLEKEQAAREQARIVSMSKAQSRRKGDESPYDFSLEAELEPVSLNARWSGQPLSGVANDLYTSDAVRSEAELIEVIQRLQYDELRNPDIRSRRTTATIPDMVLDPQEREALRFVNDNHKVEDPLTFYHVRVPQAPPNHQSRSALIYKIKSRRNSKESRGLSPELELPDFGPVFSNNGDTDHIWTCDEKDIFVREYLLYPKQFEKIAMSLPHKSARDCVLFYYRNKKPLGLKFLLQKQARKARRGRKVSAKKRKERIKERKENEKRAKDAQVRRNREPSLGADCADGVGADNDGDDIDTNGPDDLAASDEETFLSHGRGNALLRSIIAANRQHKQQVLPYLSGAGIPHVSADSRHSPDYDDDEESGSPSTTSTKKTAMQRTDSRDPLYLTRRQLQAISRKADNEDASVNVTAYPSENEEGEVIEQDLQLEEIAPPPTKPAIPTVCSRSPSLQPDNESHDGASPLRDAKKPAGLRRREELVLSESGEWDRMAPQITESTTEDSVPPEDAHDIYVASSRPLTAPYNRQIFSPSAMPPNTGGLNNSKNETSSGLKTSTSAKSSGLTKDKSGVKPPAAHLRIDTNSDIPKEMVEIMIGADQTEYVGAAKWKREEREKAIKEFIRCGPDFAEASRTIRTKTASQCRYFYNKFVCTNGKPLANIIMEVRGMGSKGLASLPFTAGILDKSSKFENSESANPAIDTPMTAHPSLDSKAETPKEQQPEQSAETATVIAAGTIVAGSSTQNKPSSQGVAATSISVGIQKQGQKRGAGRGRRVSSENIRLFNTNSMRGKRKAMLSRRSSSAEPDSLTKGEKQTDMSDVYPSKRRKSNQNIETIPEKEPPPAVPATTTVTAAPLPIVANNDESSEEEEPLVAQMSQGVVPGFKQILSSQPDIPDPHSRLRELAQAKPEQLNPTAVANISKLVLPPQTAKEKHASGKALVDETPIPKSSPKEAGEIVETPPKSAFLNYREPETTKSLEHKPKASVESSSPAVDALPIPTTLPHTTSKGAPKKSFSSYWSVHEKSIFQHYFTLLGPNWENMSKVIRTKTSTQVRNYYNAHRDRLGLEQLLKEYEDQKTKGLLPDPNEVIAAKLSRETSPAVTNMGTGESGEPIKKEKRGRKRKSQAATALPPPQVAVPASAVPPTPTKQTAAVVPIQEMSLDQAARLATARAQQSRIAAAASLVLPKTPTLASSAGGAATKTLTVPMASLVTSHNTIPQETVQKQPQVEKHHQPPQVEESKPHSRPSGLKIDALLNSTPTPSSDMEPPENWPTRSPRRERSETIEPTPPPLPHIQAQLESQPSSSRPDSSLESEKTGLAALALASMMERKPPTSAVKQHGLGETLQQPQAVVHPYIEVINTKAEIQVSPRRRTSSITNAPTLPKHDQMPTYHHYGHEHQPQGTQQTSMPMASRPYTSHHYDRPEMRDAHVSQQPGMVPGYYPPASDSVHQPTPRSLSTSVAVTNQPYARSVEPSPVYNDAKIHYHTQPPQQVQQPQQPPSQQYYHPSPASQHQMQPQPHSRHQHPSTTIPASTYKSSPPLATTPRLGRPSTVSPTHTNIPSLPPIQQRIATPAPMHSHHPPQTRLPPMAIHQSPPPPSLSQQQQPTTAQVTTSQHQYHHIHHQQQPPPPPPPQEVVDARYSSYQQYQPPSSTPPVSGHSHPRHLAHAATVVGQIQPPGLQNPPQAMQPRRSSASALGAASVGSTSNAVSYYYEQPQGQYSQPLQQQQQQPVIGHTRTHTQYSPHTGMIPSRPPSRDVGPQDPAQRFVQHPASMASTNAEVRPPQPSPAHHYPHYTRHPQHYQPQHLHPHHPPQPPPHGR